MEFDVRMVPQPVIIGASMQNAMHIHMQSRHSYIERDVNMTFSVFVVAFCCQINALIVGLGAGGSMSYINGYNRLFDMGRIFCNPLLVLSSFMHLPRSGEGVFWKSVF